jgi:hypothetical protein
LKKSIEREFSFQSLQEGWDHFAADVLPDASEDKQRSMHNAFFSGASAAYLLFLRSLKAPNWPESRALAQALFEELDAFMMDEIFEKIVPTEGNA